MTDPTALPRITGGKLYEGNQEYKGAGIQRWCAICGTHKPYNGGHVKFVLGGNNWVCAKHPKVKK